jgi:hypothetical protein
MFVMGMAVDMSMLMPPVTMMGITVVLFAFHEVPGWDDSRKLHRDATQEHGQRARRGAACSNTD